jgi:hypothetical protein
MIQKHLERHDTKHGQLPLLTPKRVKNISSLSVLLYGRPAWS